MNLNLRTKVTSLVALSLLVPAAVAATGSLASGSAAAAEPTYDATIRITQHGIPHIEADSFPNLAYGAGWATAAESTCTLMDTLLTGRGLRSEYLGPDKTLNDRVGGYGTNLQWDTLVTDLHDRGVVEDLLADPVAGPSDTAKAMITGEAAGINKWLSTHEITDPACADQTWIKPDVTATDVWYAIYLAQLIGSTTRFLNEITTATPPAAGAATTKVDLANVDPEALRKSLGDDAGESFGSNATAVGGSSTSTQSGMLLGNPHFPWIGRYRFTEMHLTIPGQFDAAGGALTGFPTINIGFNDNVAWSHTVSTGYRFTPYQYTTAGTPTSYRTADGGTAQLEERHVSVPVKTDDGVETVTRTLYRTPQGYVLNSPSQFMTWTAGSFWAMRDANAEHLRTLDTFLSMAQASSVRDLLDRQDAGGGMPWVNTIAADRAGDVLYADHSVIPNVTNALAEKCMTAVGRLLYSAAGLPGLDGTRADGECAWGTDSKAERPGILGPEHLPDVVRRDWVVNANDSYWMPNDHVRLTGYPRIIGCEACERSMRTKVVMAYVRDRLAKGKKENPLSLRSHEYANRVYAGEVARVGGRLDQVCKATGHKRACKILKNWDGRSNTTSVGTAIFQEFVRFAANDGVDLWKVPFDPKHPLTTPRTLSTAKPVVKAMRQAITTLQDAGIKLSAPYGSMHQSGDRGDEAGIPVSGGLGDLSGDANATNGSGDPVIGRVQQGSSYIQEIAFKGETGVNAHTILTYSQYEDPASEWSNDQTHLFSHEEWVTFPWTEEQIARQLVDTVHLTS